MVPGLPVGRRHDLLRPRPDVRWWVVAAVVTVSLSGCAAGQAHSDQLSHPAAAQSTPTTPGAMEHHPQRHHVGKGRSKHHAKRHTRHHTQHDTKPPAKPRRREHEHHQAQHGRHQGHHRIHVVGVPAKDLPRPDLTPGAVLTTSAAAVCVSGYASSVRDVPDSEKEAVYARYGVPHVPYAHEVDHLVSLELGGSNAIRNLWPEPYAGRWGARTKDVLENRLHDLVCAGALTLRHAQRIEARNWVAAYDRYVGTPPVPSPSGQALHHRRHRTHRGGTTGSSAGCEPGYSPCLPRAEDLDCDQIPDWKTPVRVTGDDPYRLDADGDGSACE